MGRSLKRVCRKEELTLEEQVLIATEQELGLDIIGKEGERLRNVEYMYQRHREGDVLEDHVAQELPAGFVTSLWMLDETPLSGGQRSIKRNGAKLRLRDPSRRMLPALWLKTLDF